MQYVVQNTGVPQLLEQEYFPANTHFVGVIPFVNTLQSETELVGRDYIPYGSTALVKIASSLKWKGCYFNEHDFRYSTSCYNREDMLNSAVMTVEDALRRLEYYSPTSLHFVRPDKDLKDFAGAVMSVADTLAMLSSALQGGTSKCNQLDKEDLIVVSSVREVINESRWFIVNREIVSGSYYRINGQRVDKKIDDPYFSYQAQKMADGWLPNLCCVMDLACTSTGLAVVEFNCINCAGFYANDKKLVIDRLLAYASENCN